MADDDQIETTTASESQHREPVLSERAVGLPPMVSDWLGSRVETAPGEVVVAVSVVSSRWVVRVEYGATASSLDAPSRGEHTASEVAAAIRRWARAVGHTARFDGQHAGEARVAITPVASTRS
jgi:hypothetical protein